MFRLLVDSCLKKCAHGVAWYQNESSLLEMHAVSEGGGASSHNFVQGFLYRDDLEIKPCERYS